MKSYFSEYSFFIRCGLKVDTYDFGLLRCWQIDRVLSHIHENLEVINKTHDNFTQALLDKVKQNINKQIKHYIKNKIALDVVLKGFMRKSHVHITLHWYSTVSNSKLVWGLFLPHWQKPKREKLPTLGDSTCDAGVPWALLWRTCVLFVCVVPLTNRCGQEASFFFWSRLRNPYLSTSSAVRIDQNWQFIYCLCVIIWKLRI